MNTQDRIAKLLAFTGLEREVGRGTHDIIDMIDTQMSVDTAYIGECSCVMHHNGACSARRYVGARLALLEECMAREEITNEISSLQEQYGCG